MAVAESHIPSIKRFKADIAEEEEDYVGSATTSGDDDTSDSDDESDCESDASGDRDLLGLPTRAMVPSSSSSAAAAPKLTFVSKRKSKVRGKGKSKGKGKMSDEKLQASERNRCAMRLFIEKNKDWIKNLLTKHPRRTKEDTWVCEKGQSIWKMIDAQRAATTKDNMYIKGEPIEHKQGFNVYIRQLAFTGPELRMDSKLANFKDPRDCSDVAYIIKARFEVENKIHKFLGA